MEELKLEKAYDFDALAKVLKEKGLVEVEDGVRTIVVGVVDFLKQSARLSPSKVDDFLVGLYEMGEERLLEQVDKIDGQKE